MVDLVTESTESLSHPSMAKTRGRQHKPVYEPSPIKRSRPDESCKRPAFSLPSRPVDGMLIAPPGPAVGRSKVPLPALPSVSGPHLSLAP